MDDRARIQFVDVLLSFAVLVAIIALSPVFGRFTGMVVGEADPFSALLLQLVMPLLVVALILSAGRSARGGA
jgi:hypothetical protein